MPPFRATSPSSDEDEGPESLSLFSSKQTVQEQAEALRILEAASKLKKRVKNKERDQRLKEQAQRAKKRQGKETSDELNARMERAMMEAEEEGSDEEDVDDQEEAGEMSVDEEDSEEDEDDEVSEDSGIDEESIMDDEEETIPTPLQSNPNHLPDHLFASAFSSQPSSSRSQTQRTLKKSGLAASKKRKRSANASKDLIVGSRTIRALAATERPHLLASARVAPSTKVKKFLDRSLGLKGSNSNSKRRGWERRAANIGVLKPDGPATSFVRQR